MITPTWLPATITRDPVFVETLDGTAPSYRVRYGGANGSLSFELGPPPSVSGMSGAGYRVRGVGAVLSFPYDGHTTPRPKILSWKEGLTYTIRADEGISGDDLMQAAWALASTSPPPQRPYPYVRRAVGACSRPDMTPEQLVTKILSLTASGDADAMNDCFALELIEQGPSGFAGWATMGPVSDVQIRRIGVFGGRTAMGATWTFQRDPGGAWGFPRASHFLTLGLEADRLRVYELGTAVAALPK